MSPRFCAKNLAIDARVPSHFPRLKPSILRAAARTVLRSLESKVAPVAESKRADGARTQILVCLHRVRY